MRKTIIFVEFLMILAMLFGIQARVFAHCDTLEGPVIKEAKVALESKDITPLLKWIPKKQEAEVKATFEKVLKERVKGGEAGEKADMEFFEILVRIHRESEGAPFTGIKLAGTLLEPAVASADKAIEAGTVDFLIEEISNSIVQGIRERFNRVIETKKHMNESVEYGREYVKAYVEYVHYIEGIHKSVSGVSSHHLEGETAEEKHHHKQ